MNDLDFVLTDELTQFSLNNVATEFVIGGDEMGFTLPTITMQFILEDENNG